MCWQSWSTATGVTSLPLCPRRAQLPRRSCGDVQRPLLRAVVLHPGIAPPIVQYNTVSQGEPWTWTSQSSIDLESGAGFAAEPKEGASGASWAHCRIPARKK